MIFDDKAEAELEKQKLLIRAICNNFRKPLIRELLQKPGQTVTELYVKFRCEQSIASQHLAVLRGVELAYRIREGKHFHYFINEQLLKSIIHHLGIHDGLQKYYINDHTQNGKYLKWWNRGADTHIECLENAGRYTREQAEEITKKSTTKGAHLCAKVDYIVDIVGDSKLQLDQLSLIDADIKGRHFDIQLN